MLLLVMSCNSETQQHAATDFFSLKHFFEQESIRLKGFKTVNKRVQHNEKAEQKAIFIGSWAKELSIFSESDINKPAWRDSYRVVQDSAGVCYSALDSALRTRSIFIKRNAFNKVVRVDIVNRTDNALYQSNERLVYIPDSLYSIDKKQHVLLLGDDYYQITGRF